MAFWPKTPYAIPNLPKNGNQPRTHGDRLARHATTAAESEADVIGREHEQRPGGARGEPTESGKGARAQDLSCRNRRV